MEQAAGLSRSNPSSRSRSPLAAPTLLRALLLRLRAAAEAGRPAATDAAATTLLRLLEPAFAHRFDLPPAGDAAPERQRALPAAAFAALCQLMASDSTARRRTPSPQHSFASTLTKVPRTSSPLTTTCRQPRAARS